MKKFLILYFLITSTVFASYPGETPSFTTVKGGNLKLSSNTVSSENTNGSIVLDPNGTGSVNLPDLTASLPLKLNGSKNVTSAAVDLSGSEVTSTLPVTKGGTGAATLTANNVLLGNGTSAVQFVAPGTSGNVLTSTGSGWSSSAPTLTDAVKSATAGPSNLYVATASTTSGSVVSDRGDWINGNCSAANPTVCTFNSGKFANTPFCWATLISNSAVLLPILSVTSTTVSIKSILSTTGADQASIPFTVFCFGDSP